ncbi:MAG: TRM11 family SAM-dependent methyltransferase [Candidatus Thorarchaeota archaeon]
MTDLVFILGKNWLLSLAEVIVLLEDKGLLREIRDYSKTSLIVSTTHAIKDEVIVDIQSALGGAFKVGRVIYKYEIDEVAKAYPSKGSFSKSARQDVGDCPWLHSVWRTVGGKKIKFGVSTYPSQVSDAPVHYIHFTKGLSEFIKRKLLEKGARKADYVMYEQPDRRVEKRINTSLWPQSLAKHNLLIPPNAEVLAAITESKVYIAKTVIAYDSMLQQLRDESRPFISSEISTSPKVCRTLLTLSGARPGDTVLDPFCGTGTLLMEAALLDMKCIGIDIDGNTSEGTKSNLIWLGRELGSYINFTVLKGDAREVNKLVSTQVDAVACEPHLGPVFRKRPERRDAEKQIVELTKLYRDALNAIDLILRADGRVALTIPVILTKNGDVSMDIREMTRGTRFQIYNLLPDHAFRGIDMKSRKIAIKPNRPVLPERKRGQIVQRAVVMLGRG